MSSSTTSNTVSETGFYITMSLLRRTMRHGGSRHQYAHPGSNSRIGQLIILLSWIIVKYNAWKIPSACGILESLYLSRGRVYCWTHAQQPKIVQGHLGAVQLEVQVCQFQLPLFFFFSFWGLPDLALPGLHTGPAAGVRPRNRSIWSFFVTCP